jgi:hypothetical protein
MSNNLQGLLLWVISAIALITSGIYGVLNKKQKNNVPYQIMSKGQIIMGILAIMGLIILLFLGKFK